MKNRRKHITARNIASLYHGGGGSALYVLASTGALVLNDQGMEWLNVRDEVQGDLDFVRTKLAEGNPNYDGGDEADLSSLLHYVNEYGSRGPVEGWGQLSW